MDLSRRHGQCPRIHRHLTPCQSQCTSSSPAAICSPSSSLSTFRSSSSSVRRGYCHDPNPGHCPASPSKPVCIRMAYVSSRPLVANDDRRYPPVSCYPRSWFLVSEAGITADGAVHYRRSHPIVSLPCISLTLMFVPCLPCLMSASCLVFYLSASVSD